MPLPLYRLERTPQRGRDGNAGLWYDKFCDTWAGGWSMRTDGSSPKLEWMKKLADGKRVGEEQTLRSAALRVAALVRSTGGEFGVFRTTSRFVTGLGRSHPVENGFAWHHTLGAPYLAGSSIKGLVRSWAEEWGGADRAEIDRVLGARSHSGTVAFLDAVPVEPVRLDVDIVTPHHAAWAPADPPGDWRSPVPSPFLVVAEGSAMLFGVVPLRGARDGDPRTAWGWLGQALACLGAGAKTAVGYGRFARDDRLTARLESRLGEAEGRGAGAEPALSEAELLDEIRRRLEKGELADPAERAAWAREMLRRHGEWVAAWKRGRKVDPATQLGARKLKERARLLARAAEGDGWGGG